MSLRYDEPATGQDVETDVVGGKNVQVMKMAFGLSAESQRVDETAPLPVTTSPAGSTSWGQATYTGGFGEVIRFAVPAATQWLLLSIESASMDAALQAQFSIDGGTTFGVVGIAMLREVTQQFGYAFIDWRTGYDGGAKPSRWTVIGPMPPWITHFRINVTGGAGSGSSVFRIAAMDKSWDISSLAVGAPTSGALGGVQISGYDAGSSQSKFIPTFDKFNIDDTGSNGLAVALVTMSSGLTFRTRSAPVTTLFDSELLDIPVGSPATVVTGTVYADVVVLVNTTTELQDFTLTDISGPPRDYGGEDLRPNECRVLPLYGLKFNGGIKAGALNAGLKIQVKGWQA